MQQNDIHAAIAAAKQRALDAISSGQTTLDLKGPSYYTAMIKSHVARELKAHNHTTKITAVSENGITLTLIPEPKKAATGQRGRPKSELRLTIEGLNPGQTTWISTEEGDPFNVRATISSVKSATGREFFTEIEGDEGTLAVTRTDNLDQAPEHLRVMVTSHLKATRDRWPFARLEPGEHETIKSKSASDLASARSLATYWKRKRGKAFSVQSDGNEIKVTRLI